VAFLDELIDMQGRPRRDIGTARLIEDALQVSSLEDQLLSASEDG
jgi:hypothetical protein